MKKWIKRILRRANQATSSSASRAELNTEQPAPDAPHTYSSDQPIRSRGEDRFNRWAFAERIASTIAGRRDPTSIVIGLYGPWGDGKTSTLHLMEAALENHDHVIAVRFNPWLFQSEERLLKGFFATLAEALDRSLATLKEKIGRVLNDYGSLLSFASVPGDAAKGIGQALPAVALEKLSQRVEKFLAESGKRVVVLIDDIDRLDRTEIQAIFKLVKLSASFNHTSYVLSFDDEMVAAAIGERYGEGGYEAGRAFLEKIVQVPLHLPPPDQNALRQMTFEGIDAALTQSGITLPQEQVDAFVRHFDDGLMPQLRTPRHAKLYINALTFALPLLNGEVHAVDLMLIEGIRVFYSKLYIAIRDNPEYFLKATNGGQQAEAYRRRAAELIDNGLDGAGVQNKGQVRRRLLEVLFPRLSNIGYGPDWDQRWAREQRVCSDQYFRRYFTYSVPPGDISDLEIRRLLDTFTAMEVAQQDAALRAYSERNAWPQVIRKLREREGEIDPAIARPLALAIARNGASLPRERGMLFATDRTFRQGGILVTHLLKRVPAGEEREALAHEVFRQAETLPFAVECLRWVQHSQDRPEADRVISAEAEQGIGVTLAERIRNSADEMPLYQRFGRDAQLLYWLWNKHGDGTVVATHLRARFEANPDELDQFLDTYVGEAWGMDTGLSRRADFGRDGYDAIARLIDTTFIAAKLRERYGAELDAAQFHHDDTVPLARRIAHQFVFIHQRVLEERAAAIAGPRQARP